MELFSQWCFWDCLFLQSFSCIFEKSWRALSGFHQITVCFLHLSGTKILFTKQNHNWGKRIKGWNLKNLVMTAQHYKKSMDSLVSDVALADEHNFRSKACCVFIQVIQANNINTAWILNDGLTDWMADVTVLTRPAAWCFCSSCIASSQLPFCTWLCTLVQLCGWWTLLLGWSPWSALPPLSDILRTNMQKKLTYHLAITKWLWL